MVEKLKQKIAKNTGLKKETQFLLFNDKLLDDHSSLESNEISDGSKIKLTAVENEQTSEKQKTSQEYLNMANNLNGSLLIDGKITKNSLYNYLLKTHNKIPEVFESFFENGFDIPKGK